MDSPQVVTATSMPRLKEERSRAKGSRPLLTWSLTAEDEGKEEQWRERARCRTGLLRFMTPRKHCCCRLLSCRVESQFGGRSGAVGGGWLSIGLDVEEGVRLSWYLKCKTAERALASCFAANWKSLRQR